MAFSDWHKWRYVLVTVVLIFVAYTAIKALSAAFWNDDFPESLAIKVELLPLVFPLHMLTGGLALVLIPVTYAARRHRAWHQPLGWIATADIMLAGVTAFPVAWVAPVTLWSSAGFTAQALVWLGFLIAGIAQIRRKRRASHRVCMMLMAATASGALFFRILLASWAIVGSGRHFETVYACDAWIAWALPLALCAVWLQRNRPAVA